jgi:hypothetical protein
MRLSGHLGDRGRTEARSLRSASKVVSGGVDIISRGPKATKHRINGNRPKVAHGFDFLPSSHGLSRPSSVGSDVVPGEELVLIGVPLAFLAAGRFVDVAAPHDGPLVLLSCLVLFGALVGHVVLPGVGRRGGAGPVAGGGLPAAASSAVRGRRGSGSRDQGGKFLGERSGPGRGGQEVSDPLDAEGGRCKLGASSTVPPQAGPLTFLGRRGLE